MSLNGSDTAWSDEERSDATGLSFAEFTKAWPSRTYDAWRIKRARIRSGKVPLSGDGRVDRFAALREGAAVNAKRERVSYPKGWEPGVAWDGSSGVLTTGPLGRDVKWDDVLRVWDLDPELFEVIEPVQYRAWDAAIGNGEIRRSFYYKANIRSRGPISDRVDVEALLGAIRGRPTFTRPAMTPVALVVVLSDWQIGKKGTEATVGRIMALRDSVEIRIAELASVGRSVGELVVLGLGDIFEGCTGFYDMQEFEVELDRRDQEKLTRHLLVDLLTHWSTLVNRVVVAAIGGNHGENRKNGKAYTSFADNDDVAVFEVVAEILAANPAYAHVSFVLPHEHLTLTLNVANVIVGIAHGHQVKGTVEAWWKGQTFGRRALSDADILVTAHRHHFASTQHGSRIHFQAPTLDSGSQWFSETVGTDSIAGTLTFAIGPAGWSDLSIL